MWICKTGLLSSLKPRQFIFFLFSLFHLGATVCSQSDLWPALLLHGHHHRPQPHLWCHHRHLCRLEKWKTEERRSFEDYLLHLWWVCSGFCSGSEWTKLLAKSQLNKSIGWIFPLFKGSLCFAHLYQVCRSLEEFFYILAFTGFRGNLQYCAFFHKLVWFPNKMLYLKKNCLQIAYSNTHSPCLSQLVFWDWLHVSTLYPRLPIINYHVLFTISSEIAGYRISF